MKTNQEKYDHYCKIINQKDTEAFNQLFPNGAPTVFYIIEKFDTKALDVTSIKRSREDFYMKCSSEDRISRADVSEVKKIAEEWTPPELSDFYVYYSYKQQYGTVSGAYPYLEIGLDPRLSWTAEGLLSEIEHLREMYAAREGYEPCTYCRKQAPSGSMVTRTVYYRASGRLAQMTCRYCSTDCGGFDQMSREG